MATLLRARRAAAIVAREIAMTNQIAQTELPQPAFVWGSTRESIEAGTPSVAAIVETLVAAPVYWSVAIYYETYGPLIFSACVALLVLTRSDDSVKLGVKWFSAWERNSAASERDWSDLTRTEKALVLTVATVSIVLMFFVSYTMAKEYLVGVEGFAAFSRSVALGAVAVAAAVAAAAAVAGAGAGAVARVFLTVLAFPFIVGVASGIFLVALAIRVAATLVHFRNGLSCIAGNFRKLAVCTSPLQVPELVPGLKADESQFTFESVKTSILNRTGSTGADQFLDVLANLVGGGIWFLPAWLYRFTIKSTAWVWWPLAFVARPAKLAHTPEWQYRAMVGTLVGWIGIALASYSDILFVATRFLSDVWQKEFPKNPFMSAIGYLLVLDWGGKFWPIFTIVGPALSLATLVWLNHTFRKYKVARANSQGGRDSAYLALQREAERTFPVIEIVQRIQTVLFAIYCFLVLGQMGLYFNAEKCWFPTPPNVQAWSDWLYAEKSPHPACTRRD